MKMIYIVIFLTAVSSAIAATQSPYIGEKSYEIKSLSPDEINGLLQGNGMGFAKAAELNKYPGPRHVLDLAGQLHLSNKQISQTNLIFKSMRERAIDLGAQLVNYERELDTLFSSGNITASDLDSMLLKIGEARAKIRGAHLHAHLEMKQILTHHQVMMYENLRGYSGGNGEHKHNH